MTDQKLPENMKEKILREIREKHIAIKPKWQFVLKTILIIFVLSIVAFYIMFHTSFLFYSLHHNGSLFLPQFGMSGIKRLFWSFPWLWAIAGILLTVIFGIIIENKTRAYRFPLLYTVLAVIIVVTLTGVLCVILPIHTTLRKINAGAEIPIIGPLYNGLPENELFQTYIGEVSDLQKNSFTLINRNGQAETIYLEPQTDLPNDFQLENGVEVMIIGEEKAGCVEAEGIRALYGGYGQEIHERIHNNQ